jgi:predicted Zn finger-like uncharacterized protein
MALATRCPSCQARFRVAPDQLKLRGGLVRCGACRHVFDAIGTLSYVDDAVLATPPGATQPAVGAVIAAIRKAESTVGEAIATDSGPSPEATPEPAPADDAPTVAAEPATTIGTALSDEAMPNSGAQPGAAPFAGGLTADQGEREEPVARKQDELVAEAQEQSDLGPPGFRATPVAGEFAAVAQPVDVASEVVDDVTATNESAASFLREAAAPRKPGRRLLLGAAAVLLAALALAQVAVAFRAEIAAAIPQARPALGQLCRLFRCTVGWPTRPEVLAVVGTELQLLPGTTAFELTAVVRNRGQVTVALPAIELTLTDTLNRTVARRIFSPTDYLAGKSDAKSQIEAGLAAGADLSVHVAFEARGINAAGFVVYPFYL